MPANKDVKIITVKPKNLTLAALAAKVSAGISECHKDGYIDTDVRINETNGAIEIIAEKIREYDIRALPDIVLSATTVNVLSTRRDEAKIRNYYNRIQNTKYNAALRNYKGHKK